MKKIRLFLGLVALGAAILVSFEVSGRQDIECITDAAPIEVVVCNGGTAGRLYKRYLQDRTGLPAIVLPSTSPANAAWRLERLVERWSGAADWQAFSI